CILNSGGYFVNLLPFLAMRKEPPYKNSIVLFILSIIRGSFHFAPAFYSSFRKGTSFQKHPFKLNI
ncbi:hypothetical protein, partial [Streptococcus sp. S784/96/1]|uniref:hypothetical protein n=1 Tax=Streptococcus sp. S784/96/1 TaxID=2653499 RepID=UPI001EE41CDE